MNIHEKIKLNILYVNLLYGYIICFDNLTGFAISPRNNNIIHDEDPKPKYNILINAVMAHK